MQDDPFGGREVRTWSIVGFIAVCFAVSGCEGKGDVPQIIPGTDLGPAPSVSSPNQAEGFPHEQKDLPDWYRCLTYDLTSSGHNQCREGLGTANSDLGKPWEDK